LARVEPNPLRHLFPEIKNPALRPGCLIGGGKISLHQTNPYQRASRGDGHHSENASRTPNTYIRNFLGNSTHILTLLFM